MIRETLKRESIGVIGSARMGVALAHQLAEHGRDVVLYTTMEDRAEALRAHRALPEIIPELAALHASVEVTTNPHQLAASCTLVFVTTSDYLLEGVISRFGDHLDGAHLVVHMTHSLYGERLTRTSQLIEELTCVKQIGALAGPIHVSELLAMNPNVALVGSEFPEVIVRTSEVLASSNFRVYGSNDIRGLEYAAALHQVVALAAGLVDGAGIGSATRSAMVSAGLGEITRVGVACGAGRESFHGLVGVGRLVDALQRGEPNYELGVALGRSPKLKETLANASVEAKSPEVIALLLEWAAARDMRLPFVESMGRVLRGEARIGAECRGLMTRSELFAQSLDGL